MTRVAIDPVTRVNGHLRIEVELAAGIVTDAWSAGQMYRGLERTLVGRDPRDAWLMAQRICGTCGPAHALASVAAVEQALDIRIPANARLLRELIVGARTVVAHTADFYVRQVLDWVDPTAAIRADPVAAARLAAGRSDRAGTDAASLRTVQDRLSVLLGSGEPEPFATGFWRESAYTLEPEASLVILGHYFEALEWQRRMTQLQAILGGKSPHPQTFLVGGMALAPTWGGPRQPDTGQHPWTTNRNAPAPLSKQGMQDISGLLDEISAFVEDVYVPDTLLLGTAYRSWADIGTGIGHYLSFGAYPEDGTDQPALLFPRGRVMDRDVTHLVEVGDRGVAETVAHAHYADDRGDALVHPSVGQTQPAYAGPAAPVTSIGDASRYSWAKAPRYEDDPMESGPAARMLVAYAAGADDIKVRLDRVAAQVGIPITAYGSTLGRLLARAVEAAVLSDRLHAWFGSVQSNLASGDLAIADITRWDPGTWPSTAEGSSMGESPGGATGHWLRIADRRIAAYQVVDGNEWNVSPRDQRGRRGAIEQALLGTSVVDPAQPVEILRTVHSFDPCIACAVH